MIKLVEIKNVSVNQVWFDSITGFTWVVISTKYKYEDLIIREVEVYDENLIVKDGNYFDELEDDEFEGIRLIGKLGITHKIEDNKLIEIPQSEDRYVGDIIKDNDNIEHLIMEIFEENYYDDCECFYHLFCNKYKISTKSEVSVSKFNKIGIYGVTHEFVNDCEVDND